MGVRVRIRIRVNGIVQETAALVNTGFETEEPELLIPIKLAERFRLYPPPKGTQVAEYVTAAGPALMVRLPSKIQVEMSYERTTRAVEAVAVMGTLEQEVLISDSLAEELKIAIQNPRKGLWRFRDEEARKTRPSEKPQYWA